MAPQERPSGVAVWSALGSVYLLWGSTYLAIAIAVETLPPFLSAGVRFFTAGVLVAGWLTFRRVSLRASFAQIRGAVIVGLLLLACANGLVVYAEKTVPSGVAALIVASIPLWIVLLRAINREHVRRDAIGGVLLGLTGVAILVIPGGLNGTLDPIGVLLLLVATMSWATGTYISPRLPSPRITLVSSMYQMLAAGVALFIVALVRGEVAHVDPATFAPRSMIAIGYLVVFGSIVAFTAYTWLLQNAPVSLVATYAFVNPVVAVILGTVVRGEAVTPTIVAGAAVIVAAVAFIVWRQNVHRAAASRAPAVAAAD